MGIAVDELVRKVLLEVMEELEIANIPLTEENVKQAVIEKKKALFKNDVENS